MTDEIIVKIKEAEAEGLRLKAEATDLATKMIATAEDKAERIQNDSDDFCKSYRETQQKNAEWKAQEAYEKAMKKSREDAEKYARDAKEKAHSVVGEIVGRILSGNR